MDQVVIGLGLQWDILLGTLLLGEVVAILMEVEVQVVIILLLLLILMIHRLTFPQVMEVQAQDKIVNKY
jgi:phosphatidylserine synthase